MTGCKLLRAMPTALSLVLVAGGAPALAQSGDTVSRAVVQPLPPAASDDLNAALLRLAADRRDVDALISAGLASLSLDDIDAAIGFFGRAKELSPENPRIAEGMGAAYVRSGRPVEALSLFEQADQAGIGTGTLWADRGLAYDLVGQNDAAQTAYRRALQGKNDPAVRQRLALSYAIAGNREAFEDELRPLLEERDYNAYRTRAFGLAVLGQADEALEIARAVMPRDLAGRMEPYLRFMPRLTKPPSKRRPPISAFIPRPPGSAVTIRALRARRAWQRPAQPLPSRTMPVRGQALRATRRPCATCAIRSPAPSCVLRAHAWRSRSRRRLCGSPNPRPSPRRNRRLLRDRRGNSLPPRSHRYLAPQFAWPNLLLRPVNPPLA